MTRPKHADNAHARQGMKRTQKIVIIAGPNGAGKTTFAREFLPREANCPTSSTRI